VLFVVIIHKKVILLFVCFVIFGSCKSVSAVVLFIHCTLFGALRALS